MNYGLTLVVPRPVTIFVSDIITPEGLRIVYASNGLSKFGFKSASKNNFIDDWLFRYYEEVATRVKYLKIKPGDIMLDVGASVGSWAIPAALLGARVHAFEIGKPQIYALALNMQLNKLTADQIRLHCVALHSNDDTDLVFDGAMKLRKKEFKVKGLRAIPVESVSLDTWINQHRDELQLSHIDYVKIDVEGMEYEVLRGAYHTLLEFKPKLIIEIHEAEGVHMRSNVESLLKELKYKHEHVHPLHDYFY